MEYSAGRPVHCCLPQDLGEDLVTCSFKNPDLHGCRRSNKQMGLLAALCALADDADTPMAAFTHHATCVFRSLKQVRHTLAHPQQVRYACWQPLTSPLVVPMLQYPYEYQSACLHSHWPLWLPPPPSWWSSLWSKWSRPLPPDAAIAARVRRFPAIRWPYCSERQSGAGPCRLMQPLQLESDASSTEMAILE